MTLNLFPYFLVFVLIQFIIRILYLRYEIIHYKKWSHLAFDNFKFSPESVEWKDVFLMLLASFIFIVYPTVLFIVVAKKTISFIDKKGMKFLKGE